MDVNFLKKEPSAGAKLLFAQKSSAIMPLNNIDLWNLFDFLLWEYQNDVDTLFNWYRELMSCGQGFNNAFITGHKFVCAATIKEGDPIYRCKTCQMDGTNLLCVECFKNSDHVDHDWTPTFTPGSGCCDCGDPESWDTAGFCSHHPGPNAGENIKISKNLERVSRLLCGYIIFILSHSLSPNHSDVLYIEKKAASKSNYVKSSNAAKTDTQKTRKTTTKSTKSSGSSGGGMFSGLFNFGGGDDDDEDEEEEDEEEEQDDATMNDKDDNDENNVNPGIVERYNKFIDLLNEAIKDCDKNEDILMIKSVEYKPDGSDYNKPGEAENCALGWEHPKDVCLESIQCNILDAMEVVWKLRMYNKCLIASAPSKYLQFVAKKWDQYKYISSVNPPYSTEIIKPKTLTRIITKEILLKIIKELKDWSNDSEILKRIIASCLMLNIDDLGPKCNGLVPIGKLSVIIPPFNDKNNEIKQDNDDIEMKENDKIEIVTEDKTAIYHLILNDHVLEQNYSAPLIDLWFALVVIPSFKERVTQVFTSCYGKMMQFWDFVNRQTQHCFVPLSVQFFTKKTTANVCESHGLIATLFDNHLLQSSPNFVKTYRKYCDEHDVNNIDSLLIFNPSQHKANWTPQWMLSKKSTHCLYDIRYLLSIRDFMKYICFDSEYDAMDHFWKHLLNLLSTYQHSKYQHRQSGRQHILMEDQTMVNVLRLDSTINGTNHRYLLNGLHELFIDIKKNENNTDQLNRALDMILNALFYGLSIINKKEYDNFDLYFKNDGDKKQMDLDDNNDDNDENERIVRMKLDNLDRGYLQCPYFRADRDNFTLTLNLSKTLSNIAKLYCDVSNVSFSELIKTLKNKFGDKLDDDNIFYWIDFSLQFISAFNQFHSDLLRKNGGIFATMIYNMEKPNFFSLFFSHHFYHIANHGTDIFNPSDFITLLFHRHLLYDWFSTNNIILSIKNKNIKETQLNLLCDPLETGWKHWADKNRVIKMIKNVLNELIAIISEPIYTLFLNNNDQHSKDVIRYELIQWLIFSKFTMSELEARVIVFGKIDRPDIRPILNDIAIFEAPEAMNAGKFRLKTEFYNEFNPYFRKYGKFNEYFGTADEQSEAINNYIKTIKTKLNTNRKKKDDNNNNKVMFPNWPYSTKLNCKSQINLLSAPFMGLIWNCFLYHMYINDKSRVNLTNFQQILRLISITVQSMIDGRFDLHSDKGQKLILNFTKHFKFRLSNEWDYIEDNNKHEIMKKYQHKSDDNKNKNKNKNKNTSNDNDNDTNMSNNDDTETKEDEHYKKALEIYNGLIPNDDKSKDEGIGSNLWFLCKMLIDSKPKDEDSEKEKEKIPKITHIGKSQQLLIEKILITLHSMNIEALQKVMDPLWSPPLKEGGKKKKKDKKKGKKTKLSAEEKRKRKAAKAREKMMKKMQKQTKKFGEENADKIKKDEMREKLEEKQQREAFGIGVKYQCIVCRSRDKQDSMSMMAFATKCCILDRCINNENKPFSDIKHRQFKDIEFYNKGLNFSFCGHCVHKSCYDTYIKQIQSAHNNQQHYAGRGSINILKKEFCCPYCKTVSNILVPLQIVYRNETMKVKQYSLMNKDKIQENNTNINYENDGNNDRTTVIRRKLCDDFFKSIFCILDRYNHSIKQHDEYIKQIGCTESTLSISHTLSYSICCEEMNFRDLPINSRKARLTRIVSNINAFIAALWSLSNQMIESSVFSRDIIKKYSWDIIQRKILNNNNNNDNNNDLKENEDEEKYCYDPFSLLCRAIICYSTTFTFNDTNTDDSEMLLLKTMIDIDNQQSNVRMDIDDEEDQENELKNDDNTNNKNEDDKTGPDLYRLLLSCYVMQICQLAISYCSNYNTMDINHTKDNKQENIKQIILQFMKADDIKQELTKFIVMRIIPFLRKSCILYNSFGCIKSLDDLWTSGIDENIDELQIECDSLCNILYIPTISNILASISNDNNKYFINYIKNINENEIDYIIKKISFWDKCKAFSLISLPSSYNDLFQIAAISKCKKKQSTPKYSAICLICGEYVCLSCCTFGIEQRGDATRHCLECNNGFGVFLWLQKSKLIIIWNNLGVLFKSVYLDKYGEEDCGLVRGNRITLNKERYHQLCQIITHHKIPNKLVQLRKTNRDLLERQLSL